ncbi:MAG: DNA-binding protein, partial [Isosphaeraceae bacterium]|nr:DNA-binding protein [Isosphaeraceae bacterium]
ATALPIKGEKDIFEDTDFEVDALDSGESSDDRTVQLEAASDFDLEDSDSASEVFAIDEEDVDQNAATAMAPAVLEEEADEFAAEAESGETPSAWDVEEAVTSAPATRAATAPVLAPAGPAAEWGTPWVVTLGVATLFMMLLAFVGMDLVRNLYEYRGDVPIGSGLVKFIASNLGG